MKTFFISDTHFFHDNIIRPTYCDRPFKRPNGEPNVKAMNQALIENWNSVVAPGDRVIHGGDFGLSSKYNLQRVFEALNGEKYLVHGNHDGSYSKMRFVGFREVMPYWTESGILVYHYPPFSQDPRVQKKFPWDEYAKCVVMLYGHIHNRPQPKGYPEAINISVEQIGYTPRTLVELVKMHPDVKI